MRLLITGGDSPLARAVIAALHQEHAIRALDSRFSAPLPEGVEAREGDLREVAWMQECLSGIEAVLHLAPLQPQAGSEEDALDVATRGTYVLCGAAREAGVSRFIVGSALALFDSLPADWNVTEEWRPRPEPRIEHLVPWLAELSARESLRGTAIAAFCLRFGKIVDSAQAGAQPFDPRWLHIEDAVAGIRCALEASSDRDPRTRDWMYHITAAGDRAKVRLARAGSERFGYHPQHDFAPEWEPDEAREGDEFDRNAPVPRAIASRPIRNVVIFGAGGPVGAAVAEEMRTSYTLRLTDARSIAEIAAQGARQSPGAPLPAPLDAPHECRVVDVRNYAEVAEACAGMDAIINLTVVRPDPVEAFRVNTLGAFNIIRAAVAHKIRRVAQTGPGLHLLHDPDHYWRDYEVSAEAPMRPGQNLYFHSKFLGQEAMRVYADFYALEVPVLLFCQFVNPETDKSLHSWAISWQDSARAIRRAVEVASLPSPYEPVNVVADLPHQKFSGERARRILQWEPRDRMERLWKRAGD